MWGRGRGLTSEKGIRARMGRDVVLTEWAGSHRMMRTLGERRLIILIDLCLREGVSMDFKAMSS